MIRTFTRRGLRASAAATVLVLVFTGQTLAAEWSAPRSVTSPGYSDWGEIVALDNSSVVALYQRSRNRFDDYAVYLKRSRDGGETWSRRLDVPWSSISGSGQYLDVATGFPEGRVVYARSVDGGRTFRTPVPLTPGGDGERAIALEVVRASPKLVAVAWEHNRDAIEIRVSTNGGKSFGARRTVVSGRNVSFGALTIDGQRFYLTYFVRAPGSTSARLMIRTSADRGTTWSPPVQLADDAETWPAHVAVANGQAYLAHLAWATRADGARFYVARYTSSDDGGSTWTEPRRLSPHGWDVLRVFLAATDDSVRAIFSRCTEEWDTCDNGRVMHTRLSADGEWTHPERVSPRSYDETILHDVAVSGEDVYVLYDACDFDACRLATQHARFSR